VKGIADAGFLVTFANRTDRYLEWAVSVAAQIGQPLRKCEAVLPHAFDADDRLDQLA
jgi:hypothetical protein